MATKKQRLAAKKKPAAKKSLSKTSGKRKVAKRPKPASKDLVKGRWLIVEREGGNSLDAHGNAPGGIQPSQLVGYGSRQDAQTALSALRNAEVIPTDDMGMPAPSKYATAQIVQLSDFCATDHLIDGETFKLQRRIAWKNEATPLKTIVAEIKRDLTQTWNAEKKGLADFERETLHDRKNAKTGVALASRRLDQFLKASRSYG